MLTGDSRPVHSKELLLFCVVYSVMRIVMQMATVSAQHRSSMTTVYSRWNPSG